MKNLNQEINSTTLVKSIVFSVLAVALSLFSFSQSTVTLTSGSGTWEVPCGVTEIEVQMWGAGGGGGNASSNNSGGSGGGAGGYSYSIITVTEGQMFAYAVGAGGAATNAGGNSSFGGMQANGGTAGGNNNGAIGIGGTASGGDNNETGGNGTQGSGSGSGSGGNSFNGGSGGDGINAGNNNGNPGEIPGGGGGGASKYSGGGNTWIGGAGGNGQIIISWEAPYPAGSGQALLECETTTSLNADGLPAGYVGTWSVSPAGPAFSNVNDPSAGVSNLALNETYTFTWTVESDPSGSCEPVSSDVIVVTESMEVDAGFDQNFCQTTFTMNANTPVAPATGVWTVVSGSASITDPSSPTTAVTGIAQGACATLRWTITDGACVGSDDVVICRPAAGASCNDDPCAAIAVPLNGCSPGAFAGSTSTQNPGQPGCGSYDFYGGDKIDVWFTATSDADGNLNLNLSGSIYLNAALYTGTCNDLTQFSCHGLNNTDPLVIQETQLPPNSTIYIRVWRRINSTTETFNICQTVPTNNSDIMPGETTIACGGSYTFFDSGGEFGSYGNNELTSWLICPNDPDQFVTIDFSMVDVEAGSFDQLIIIDGDDASDPVFQPVPNTTTGVTYTSSHESGCLLIVFRSDYTITRAGWAAMVTCTTTEVNNTALYAPCTEQDCIGGCMRTLCGIPEAVDFTGNGFGMQELGFANNGCMDTGERCANWFFLNPETAGTLTMDMYVNNGQNQDFAIWEGYQPSLDCPSATGDQPIMCNIGPSTNLGTGFNSEHSSFNTSYEDDLVITQQQIDDGVYFIMMVQTFSSGASCPQPTVTISFGGTAMLSCQSPIDPPTELDVSLLDFNAVNKGRPNYVYWVTTSERNNDFFTVQYSEDGYVWEDVGILKGASNSSEIIGYNFNHYNYANGINYYRLIQTDHDGSSETFKTVSVDNSSDRYVLKIVNILGQEVNENYRGIVIYHYSDGSYEKVYK